MTVTVKGSVPTLYNVNLYKIFGSKVELLRTNLIENMTEDAAKTMTFKSGSFIWIADDKVQHLRMCTHLEAFEAATISCKPCS